MPQRPTHLSPSGLSLWQAFVLMLHVFPTEQTQLIWGLLALGFLWALGPNNTGLQKSVKGRS